MRFSLHSAVNDFAFVPTANTWYHIATVRQGSTWLIYINGANTENKTLANTPAHNSTGRLRVGSDGGNYHLGNIDSLMFYDTALTAAEVLANYNAGTGVEYPTASTPTASERIQQEAYLQQSGTTTINSVSYVPVLSGNVEILNTTYLYGSATIPIFNPLASNEAICHIAFNGTELGYSETTRTLTAGASGNVLLTSQSQVVTPGNYTFGLECKRNGGGAYSIQNSTLYVHILSTASGVNLTQTEKNITQSAINGLITSFNLTTSQNQTASGQERSIVLEWTAEYSYNSTQNMSVTTELAGSNCTPVTRYGTSGSLGNVAGVCYRSGLTNSTDYSIKIYGSGAGDLKNGVFHVKELILHTGEINSTNLSGILMNQSGFNNISNHTITINAGHTSPHLVSEVVISVLSLNGSTSPAFYLSDGTTSSSIVSRTVGEGQPGILGIQGHYDSVTGTIVETLIGECPNQNCSLIGVEFVSYMTNEAVITPNNFYITLNDTYNETAFTNFDVIIENTTYETTTGLLEVVSEEALVNITFPATNTTDIPFFPNNTLNHDTDNNLTITARPWTMFFALEPDASTVYNFSINYTNLNDSSENGSWTTTDGTAYAPLFNGTYNVTIYGAVGNDSTNFAIQTQTINLSGYLQNYTFNLLVSNSVNITFYDEETEQIINTTTVTLEYFSEDGTSGNDTTTTGVMFVNLLLPETYTFIYDAPGYDQRFYEFTLINETFNNINLTLLNSSSSSTVTITVTDTLNNRVSDAVVKILRFDVAENQYNLIEVRRTNFEGQTIAGMVLNNPLYKFIVEVDGEVVLTTTGTQIYGTSLSLIVDLITSSGFESVFSGYTMSGAVTFSNTTNLFRFDFDDESNTGLQACLTVYRIGTARTLFNQSCSSTTSGTLTAYVLNTTGRTYQAIGTITDSNSVVHTIDSEIVVFAERISDDGSSLIMMIIMVILFATALAVSIEIALVTSFAVPVIFTATGLTSLSYGVTVPLLVIGIILAFILGVIKK